MNTRVSHKKRLPRRSKKSLLMFVLTFLPSITNFLYYNKKMHRVEAWWAAMSAEQSGALSFYHSALSPSILASTCQKPV
jgi:hypothetical protein